MRALFAFLSWRHLSRHRLRSLLALLSIALGVALFVSTEVAHHSVERAFAEAVQRMAGRATHTVTQGRGISVRADVLPAIETVPGVLAAPVLEGSVSLPTLEDEGRLLIRGVDLAREQALRTFTRADGSAVRALSDDVLEVDALRLLSDPLAILITESMARRTGLGVGDALDVVAPAGTLRLTVAGRLADRGPAAVFGGRIAFMPMAGAQRLFDRAGRYDRIDLGASVGTLDEEAVRAALPSELRLARNRTGDKTLDDMLANIRALVVLSVIGLLVGLFIVYLSVSIGVIERGRAVGAMRALGAHRSQVLRLFLGEALVLGLVGSLLGIALGWLLASGMVRLIADTVNRLVLLVEVERVVLPWPAAVIGVVAGTGTAVLAAWLPARRAAAIAPSQALRPAVLGTQLLPRYGRALVAGAVLLLVGTFITGFVQLRAPSWVGLGAMALLFLGVALMLPQLTIWVARALRAPLRRWFRAEGFLATDNVLRYPQRSALTVVALGGALALMVTSASIVASFREATDRWMDHALPFDLCIQPARLATTVYSNASLPPELAEQVRAIEGVDRVYAVRATIQEFGDHDVLVLGVDMATFHEVLRGRGLGLLGERAGADPDADLMSGRSVAVSRNFAALTGIGAGNTITLRTPTGPVTLPITHENEDYSWPRGAIAMDRSVYRRHWEDDALTYVDLSVVPGASVTEVKRRIEANLDDASSAFVYRDDDIRAYATDAIEQSFVLVNAQVVVAMAIGFLGILNTLLISVLRRQREIGLLRVVGMKPSGVARTVALEALIVSLVGGAFGIVAGLVAAAGPAANHLLLTTGYELPFVVPWGTLIVVALASIGLGLLASVLPARRAARGDVLDALRYE